MGERFEGRGSLDAWATVTALAAHTERLRLGTLVSPATFRHPSELAKVVTTASHVSGGRVELGLGAGWNEREHRAYGFEFFDQSHAARALRRAARDRAPLAGRRTSSTSTASTTGSSAAGALPKPCAAKPNLIVGGSARRGTVEPAVRFADEYNTVFAVGRGVRASAGSGSTRRASGSAATRRRFTYSLMTGCCVGADRDDLLDRARRVMDVRGDEGDPAAWLEQQSEMWVTGTPDEARERLRQLEEAGVERVMLQNLTHDDLRHVELIASLA